MGRAPFQVMLVPFTFPTDGQGFSVLVQKSAAETNRWEFISGGGEGGESPLAAARRMGQHRLGLADQDDYWYMSSIATIPVEDAGGFLWGNDVLVVPEYCFAVEVRDPSLHATEVACHWLPYDQARVLLLRDRQRNALWELRQRLLRQHKIEVHS